ncbi:uncharacterized protein LAJ45_00211 [Morchella importuna]|uniref:FAD/NAD(P)-binding domain-containing protein n=1 Tax=Morchella conica CCBAS932 TaxID=1392247 RepID=A0A3N4KR88_9PEZI|nr:uncharacterized protein LAJ45_00211 [Morchella importuna]KAH8155202.1 hypothetical protein LAJ45_00211 [Morchella importuna]RPB11822.1 FAD/NAD(P)-binding domain-containing protein [Morchella conica CCBAS932]
MGSVAAQTKQQQLPDGYVQPAELPPTSWSILPSEEPEFVSIAQTWVASLSELLSSSTAPNQASLSNIFLQNSYWRDHLCLSWDLRTFHGPSKMEAFFAQSPAVRLKTVEIDYKNPDAVSLITLIPGQEFRAVQAYLKIATEFGTGRGLVRIFREGLGGQPKAYTLYTALEELRGHEEPLNDRRPHGVDHGARQSRMSWKDRREAEIEFANGAEPTVLVVGAGQGGLTIGARLKMLGIQTLIIDKNERVGDNWRKRYHQLVLHDRVHYDHLPYIPFPPNWPVYTPKDKLGDWFESYANSMELNVWTTSTVTSTIWDPIKKHWTATVVRSTPSGQSTRVFHPRHIVMATGHSGEPNIPAIPGIGSFKGDRICHSSQFPGAPQPSTGKKAVIVGCCNSAHDIAQDWYEQGAQVTMVQRSTTCVLSSEHGMDELIKPSFHDNGPPVEDGDLNMYGTTAPVLKRLHVDTTKRINRLDNELLKGLESVGFKLDNGSFGSGFVLKYWERGGGYYIDVGASELIINRKIAIKQGQEIKQILPHGIEFADGSVLEADEIVLATGYDNMRSTAVRIFGKEVGEKVKPVWGLDEEGEIQTMWRRSGHEGFWFMGGNLGFARYFSRFLALQIKALEEGLTSYDKY